MYFNQKVNAEGWGAFTDKSISSEFLGDYKLTMKSARYWSPRNSWVVNKSNKKVAYISTDADNFLFKNRSFRVERSDNQISTDELLSVLLMFYIMETDVM